MALSHSPKIVTDGLVLCLDAGDGKSYGGSGTTWTDRSGNGYNGTLTNGPTFNSANGGSIDFDGSNDISLTTSNLTITGDQSIETFLKFNSLESFLQGLVSNHDYANTSNFGVNQVQNDKIGISIGYTDGTREYNSKYSIASVVTGRYYHIVMTFNLNANQCKLYIDGVLDSTFNLAKVVKYTSRPMVLARWDYQYPHYYFDGNIASARYYSKALTADEILQNYNAQKGRFS